MYLDSSIVKGIWLAILDNNFVQIFCFLWLEISDNYFVQILCFLNFAFLFGFAFILVHKTLPRSSKGCDCVTVRVLKYLLSTFLLYAPYCIMILSMHKCCLWSTGVSTESQKRTCSSVLQIRQDVLATGFRTRINVGLALSYDKLILSLCAIRWHGISINSGDSNGH